MRPHQSRWYFLRNLGSLVIRLFGALTRACSRISTTDWILYSPVGPHRPLRHVAPPRLASTTVRGAVRLGRARIDSSPERQTEKTAREIDTSPFIHASQIDLSTRCGYSFGICVRDTGNKVAGTATRQDVRLPRRPPSAARVQNLSTVSREQDSMRSQSSMRQLCEA